MQTIKIFSVNLGDLNKTDKIWEDFKIYLSSFLEVDLTLGKLKTKEGILSLVHSI